MYAKAYADSVNMPKIILKAKLALRMLMLLPILQVKADATHRTNMMSATTPHVSLLAVQTAFLKKVVKIAQLMRSGYLAFWSVKVAD